ncbi:hypothetical protein EVAR_20573_1 [Eumeta japonica]|uniref:Uncharacterized protein n=1 Tax=Eumeta variegata TaxID=151549 RepID=A0A4C1URX1_EUMVA|nr:hypothetical protein EVAR_20573_1 [Eumeta japonica]
MYLFNKCVHERVVFVRVIKYFFTCVCRFARLPPATRRRPRAKVFDVGHHIGTPKDQAEQQLRDPRIRRGLSPRGAEPADDSARLFTESRRFQLKNEPSP